MKNAESKMRLEKAMKNFGKSYRDLLAEIEIFEDTTNTSVNDLKGFTESYPFDKSLDELAIDEWIANVSKGCSGVEFQVLHYEYLNTGGNCMVGIFEVWLSDEKRVVYALTNEEGCTLSVVDYVRNELKIDDYDELTIDYIDWGRATGYEKYFELYRHCLNEFTKSDCRCFGYTRQLPIYLLSDELQDQITTEYQQWMEANEYDMFETNGEKIIVSEYYEQSIADDKRLREIKAFRNWHNGTAACEELYEEPYQITFAGKTVRLPYNADVWTAIDSLLTDVIEEW